MLKSVWPILVIAPLLLSACQDIKAFNEKLACQQMLTETQAELGEARSQLDAFDAPLVHMVFLKLKPELSEGEMNQLTDEISRLGEISGVYALEWGKFEDLGDQRALSAYDFAFQMRFWEKADYQAYQQDSIHLSVRAALGPYLAGPPATYDYISKL